MEVEKSLIGVVVSISGDVVCGDVPSVVSATVLVSANQTKENKDVSAAWKVGSVVNHIT